MSSSNLERLYETGAAAETEALEGDIGEGGEDGLCRLGDWLALGEERLLKVRLTFAGSDMRGRDSQLPKLESSFPAVADPTNHPRPRQSIFLFSYIHRRP